MYGSLSGALDPVTQGLTLRMPQVQTHGPRLAGRVDLDADGLSDWVVGLAAYDFHDGEFANSVHVFHGWGL